MPFPPGGGTDVIARILAERLRGPYASTVIVENKAGAAARLGVEYVKNAEADGSVMLFTPDFPITVYPHSFKSLNYDPVRDFIAGRARHQVDADLQSSARRCRTSVKTLADFVQWAKANPAKAMFATTVGRRHAAFRRRDAGAGGRHSDDAGALSRRRAGAAGSDRRPCAGERQSDQRDAAVRQFRQVRILAVTGSQRSQFLPDVPTM